jgi:hypothetical protein
VKAILKTGGGVIVDKRRSLTDPHPTNMKPSNREAGAQ